MHQTAAALSAPVQAQIAACPVSGRVKLRPVLPDGVIHLRNLAGVQLFMAVPRVLGVDVVGCAVGAPGFCRLCIWMKPGTVMVSQSVKGAVRFSA